MAHYYAQRKSIKDGVPQAPINKYGERADMEYQFYLFCANSVQNNAEADYDSVEWGTIEKGALERRGFDHPKPEPEDSEEPEEPEQEIEE